MSNHKLRILIVEDDISFRLELQMLAEEIGYEVIGARNNSAEALEAIYSLKPDMIFMDIDIGGGMTGVEVGETVKHTNIPIIFITSFEDEEHYDQAQKSNIVGYMIKPVNKFSLRTTINMAMKNMAKGNTNSLEGGEEENVFFKDGMFLKKKKTYYRIDISDIQCIESEGNYTNIYVEDEKFISKFKLDYLEEQLNTDNFLRTHRGHIINLDYFHSINIDESELKTKNGHTVLLSRAKKQILMKKMRMG